MATPNQDAEPFFITPEIAVEVKASGYEFESPLTSCTIRLHDVLGRMSDAEPSSTSRLPAASHPACA
jgi:hypothetical protein